MASLSGYVSDGSSLEHHVILPRWPWNSTLIVTDFQNRILNVRVFVLSCWRDKNGEDRPTSSNALRPSARSNADSSRQHERSKARRRQLELLDERHVKARHRELGRGPGLRGAGAGCAMSAIIEFHERAEVL